MTAFSLMTAILRFKAAKFTHLAKQAEAEDRDQEDHIPVDYWGEIETLDQWERPAESLGEAMEALEFALEEYNIGEADRIPAMMRAAIGWLRAEGDRRAEA